MPSNFVSAAAPICLKYHRSVTRVQDGYGSSANRGEYLDFLNFSFLPD